MAKEEELKSSRIFVGGLGESVTESDLVRTFSSLGKVKGVEVVRTKCRSFAYMDFEPSSEKALAKLFSMYNGCIWKGGRLKIEKAREHHLVRLKREWAEDTALVKKIPKDDTLDEKVSFEKLKKLSSEKMQLHIYFPKLRKVKGVLFSGTGKHKYSFQRIDIPSSLPIHYCDCEEHSGSVHTLGKIDTSTNDVQTGGIDEEELYAMNSVMDKLFEREEDTNVEKLSSAKNNSRDVATDVMLSDGEADQSMEEDIVMNIMTEGDDRKVDVHLIRGKESASLNKSRHSKDFEPKNKPIGKKPKVQETNDISNVALHQEAYWRNPDATGNDSADIKPVKKKISSSYASMSEVSVEEQPLDTLKSTANQPTKGAIWAQKSSWKDLVGSAGNKIFTITDILPGTVSVNHRTTENQNSSVHPSRSIFYQDSVNQAVDYTNEPEVKMIVDEEKIGDGFVTKETISEANMEDLRDHVVGLSKARLNKGHGKQNTVELSKGPLNEVHEQNTANVAVGLGEVCTFMRNAASEREWMKAKAALSGPAKKKRVGKNAHQDQKNASK